MKKIFSEFLDLTTHQSFLTPKCPPHNWGLGKPLVRTSPLFALILHTCHWANRWSSLFWNLQICQNFTWLPVFRLHAFILNIYWVFLQWTIGNKRCKIFSIFYVHVCNKWNSFIKTTLVCYWPWSRQSGRALWMDRGSCSPWRSQAPGNSAL